MTHSDRSKQKDAVQTFILFLFSFYLLVDSLNGFVTQKLGLPSVLSVAYKQLLLLSLYLYSFYYSKNTFIILNGIFLSVFSWAVFRFFLVDNIGFIHSFQEALKVAYFFIVFTVMSNFRRLTEKNFQIIMLAFTLVLLINVVFSLVGIGFTTYGSFGAKGFFYGGNALSGVIVIISSAFLCRSFQKSITNFIFTSVALLILATVIGTKSGMLGVFLVVLLVMAFNLNLKIFTLAIAVIALTTALIINLYDVLVESPILVRMTHFYDQGGLSRLLFSGREDKFMHIMPSFLEQNVAQQLLGYNKFKLNMLESTLTEFDVADMFILFGAIFTLITFIAYAGIFLKITFTSHGVISQAATISFIVLTCIAFIAGHIFFNGVVTPLWGLICAAAIATSRSKNTELRNL
ncbi:hypothetical protein [Thalassotalea agariperforans]